MKSIKIGKNIEASKIAYGCMRFGGRTKEEAKSAVLTAIEYGVNFFDNADIYHDGVSEEYFGEAIKGIDRESIFIQSKCGIRKGFYDFSKEHIISSVEGSLKRIGVDYLDVLCLHRPDVLMKGEEVAEAFDALIQEVWLKISAFQISTLCRLNTLKSLRIFRLWQISCSLACSIRE